MHNHQLVWLYPAECGLEYVKSQLELRIASRKNLTLAEEDASWEILLSRRFRTR